MKLKVFICLFVLQGICFGIKAQNTERIQDFHSDIVIDTTGRVEITESITVYAEGIDIKRGIVRSIPIYRKDNNGRKKKMDFTVLSVLRDGKEEPYHTAIANDNKEIFIGNSEVLLEPGFYKYTIVYETYGHVGFFEQYDELYWNVTGNEWAFRINKASAAISLPEGAYLIDAKCFAGAYGDSNEDCLFHEQNGKYIFETRNKLNANEGFTVAIAFSPGSIKRPPPPTLWERLWGQYGNYAYVIISLFLLGCYYIFSWRKVGRDPQKPLVVPTFDPPNKWNAPTVRRLYRKTHDKKVLTVTLVEMAVKRLIRIRQEPKKYWFSSNKYVLEKLATEESSLTPQESRILDTLFPGEEQTIEVSNKNHAIFYAVDRDLADYTPEHDTKETYRHNYGYAAIGILLTLLVLIPYLYFFTSIDAMLIVCFTFIFFLIGALLSVQAIFGGIKHQRVTAGIIGVIFMIVGLFLQQLFLLMIEGDIFHNIFIFLVELLFPVYFSLIKAPTKLGLKIDASLKGFQMYLKTAEENRLNLLTPPDHTPELFEKLLPYAIALDVENAWGKKFNQLLKQANYSPDWYQGTSAFYAAGFANTFTRSFDSSIQHAKVDPTPSTSSGSSGSSSWSSGSSGGGFSGGGGGGGGGRGW
ncbi:MAG: DUF2207 domain-containing protein [Tannerella sp.]|jgi:uncharacterized membrane protein YgcG|nr:DUF2207 domain-containing protein [Tannerella sp.]